MAAEWDWSEYRTEVVWQTALSKDVEEICIARQKWVCIVKA